MRGRGRSGARLQRRREQDGREVRSRLAEREGRGKALSNRRPREDERGRAYRVCGTAGRTGQDTWLSSGVGRDRSGVDEPRRGASGGGGGEGIGRWREAAGGLRGGGGSGERRAEAPVAGEVAGVYVAWSDSEAGQYAADAQRQDRPQRVARSQ